MTSEQQEKMIEAPKRPGSNLTHNMRGSRKSVPLLAEPTKVHATSSKSRSTSDMQEKQDAVEEPNVSKPNVEMKDAKVTEDAKSVTSSVRLGTNAWLGGWWSRPDGYASDSEKLREGTKRRKLDDSSSVPMPPTPQHEIEQLSLNTPQPSTEVPQAQGESDGKDSQGKSWFGTWTVTQNQKQKSDKLDASTPVKSATPEVQEPTAAAGPESSVTDSNAKSARPSGWAFWSYERQKDAATTPNGTQKQLGEIAVADTPSQSHPEAAQFNEQRRKGKHEKSKEAAREKASNEKLVETEEAPASSVPARGTAESETTITTPSKAVESLAQQRGKQKHITNIVSPVFRGMYSPATSSGYVERFARYLAQSLYIPGTTPSDSRHVLQKMDGLPKIKKAIAIGVHGFFPAPLLQRVLGPPTGTSIRFANHAASAIKDWCKEHQPEISEVEIEKVALEGEGLIAGRVNTLWKLLLNWTSHLRQADFILVACHSQGVPVAITLVAKLIQLGVLTPHVKIGVVAMAGINLGPFLEYKSRLFAGSALELFDFCDSSSDVSRSYFEAVDTCLRNGVRISYIGSLDDQLVSLESSLFTPLTHPYVHRATFIDGRLHTPSFLTHLVIFALKLRNLGISDHGLLRELSAPLAGSLVSGEGHSRIYDDPEVYRLAIDFALESTDVSALSYNAASRSSASKDKEKAKEVAFKRRSSISGYPPNTTQANSMRRGSMTAVGGLPGIGAVIAAYEPLLTGANSNPFYLPWAVRGMLEEEAVKRGMKDEVAELVKQFDDWKPQSKVLKDVKWRLEGVKSML